MRNLLGTITLILFAGILIGQDNVKTKSDEITLKSGITLSGKIIGETNKSVLFDNNGNTTILLRDDIENVNIGLIQPLTFDGVINVDGASKTELFNRAKLWFINAFVDSKEVLQMENFDEGQLIGKGSIPFSQSFLMGSDLTRGSIKFTIKLFFRDGRYKYVITDFSNEPYYPKYKNMFGTISTDYYCPYKTDGNQKWSNRVWWELKSTIYDRIPSAISNLDSEMRIPIESEEDNW